MAKSDKISRIVSISPAFSEEVALKDDLNNRELNQQKVRGYVPNQSSRVALKGIFEGLHPTSTKRVHLITGSYGTGKSHFGLVLANLVSRPVDDPDLAPFFTKIREKDESIYHYVRNQCAVSKPFLVVIPEPRWDPQRFNHSLLAALMEALEREGIEFCPPSNFTSAVGQIEGWQAADRAAYEKLEKALLRRSISIPIIIDRLKKFDDDAYELFKEAYSEVAHGALFQPLAVADPRKIYEETIKFLKSTGDWQGIFILYDEFSNYLIGMARDPDGVEGQMLQTFAEFCKRTGENQCHLIMIAHQTLKDYAKGYRTQQEWEKIYGRFIRGEHLLTTLSEENEMENMIDSIIHQGGEGVDEIELLKKVYVHSDLTILADIVREKDLYPNQNAEWLKSALLRGCYPLHPYATFCLPWLAEKVGQSHRTVFTFFDDPTEGGLHHYVDSTNIFTDDDRLNLYTTDSLIRYFASAAQGHPDYKHIMLARDGALSVCGAHKLSRRIVDVIAVLDIIGRPKLPPTKEIIVEALQVPSQEAHEIEQLLMELADEKKVLRFRRAPQRYELPYRTGEVDAKEAVDRIKDALRETFNLVDTLSTKYGLESIEARQYAEKHFVTRKAVREFIFPAHLSNPQSYLERIEEWYSPDRGNYEGDVLVLYVVAESAVDIANAKSYLENEACQHPQLVVAVPRTAMGFAEAVLEVEAAKSLQSRGLTTESGTVDPDDLAAFLSDAEAIIEEGLAAFLSADNFIWYCGGNVTTAKRNGEEGYISEVMEQVLPNTPAVRDVAIMTPLAGKSKKGMKDCIEAAATLLGVSGPFPIKKSGGGAVDRILRACLRETELLEKVHDKGKLEEFQVRKDPPEKSELAEIWQLLRSSMVDPSGKAVEMGKLVRTLLEPPCGLSHQLIEVLLATFLRDIKDECVIFSNHLQVTKTRNPGLYSQMPITAENLISLVSHPDDCVMYYFEVSDVEREYVTTIIEMVDPEGELADIGLWENGKNSLLGWFGALPRLTISATNFRHAELGELIELLKDQNRTRDAKQLFKQYLPQVLSVEIAEPLSKGDCDKAIAVFTTCFEELANYAQSQELLLVSRLADVFEAEGKTQRDLAVAVSKWYSETLTEPQRVHVFTGDEGYLKQAVEQDAPVVDRFLVNLPAKMGLGAYTDWGDRASFELFITKVELAKRAIEQWTPLEPLPLPDNLSARIAKAVVEVKRIFQTLSIPLENQREILARLLKEISE